MEKNDVMLTSSVCFALSLGLCWMQAPLTRVCTSIDGQAEKENDTGVVTQIEECKLKGKTKEKGLREWAQENKRHAKSETHRGKGSQVRT